MLINFCNLNAISQMGRVKVRVRPDANEQALCGAVTRRVQLRVCTLCVQVVKDATDELPPLAQPPGLLTPARPLLALSLAGTPFAGTSLGLTRVVPSFLQELGLCRESDVRHVCAWSGQHQHCDCECNGA